MSIQPSLQNKIIDAIQQQIIAEINNYAEHLTNNKDRCKLAETLKHIVNPDSECKFAMDHNHFYFKLNSIQFFLNHPEKILNDNSIQPKDYQEARDLILFSINAFTNRFVQTHDLTKTNAKLIKDENYEQQFMLKWWNKKTPEEQEVIKHQYEQLPDNKRQEFNQNPHASTINIGVNDPSIFPYFMMHQHYFGKNHFFGGPMIFDFGHHAAHGLSGPAHLLGEGLVATGKGVGSLLKGVDSAEAAGGMLIVAAITGAVSLAVSGLIGGLYALKKTVNSLFNLLTGNKVVRSIFRLGGIGGGGYGGAVGGAIAGAAIGSVIPGVGTAAGALFGTIFGAALGSGLGAFISKYIAKFISSKFYKNEFNPTNPDKYNLTKAQFKHLKDNNHDLPMIYRRIKEIKAEKDQIGLKGSIPLPFEARIRKRELNAELKKLKDGAYNYILPQNPPAYPGTSSTANVMGQTGGFDSYTSTNTQVPPPPYEHEPKVMPLPSNAPIPPYLVSNYVPPNGNFYKY